MDLKFSLLQKPYSRPFPNVAPKCCVLNHITWFVPSSPPYSWVESYESQPYWYPGVLAASSSKTQPWTCVCISSVLPYCYRWAGKLNWAACPRWERHPVPPARSATWHHLSDPDVCVNPSGLEPTIRLELPSNSQNIQCHRWEQFILGYNHGCIASSQLQLWINHSEALNQWSKNS